MYSIMWNALRELSTTLIRHPKCLIQPKRTVFVLRRKHKIRLNELGAKFPKRIQKYGYYYELVEDTNCTKKPPVEVILTQDVAGLGMKGEKIKMNMYIAYKDLLLPKLAIYANSPEAQRFIVDQKEKIYSSIYSKIVENFLACQVVKIILSNDTSWTLQPWHVKLALRKVGILTNEDCISIPRKISGPNIEIEKKNFLVYIIMNKSETFPVRCQIYHWSSSQPLLNQRSFDLHSVTESLFPDEEEKINSLRKAEEEITKKKMFKKPIRTGL